MDGVTGTVTSNGMSCKLPDALINAVAAVAKFGSQPAAGAEDGARSDVSPYVEALRANMVRGKGKAVEGNTRRV